MNVRRILIWLIVVAIPLLGLGLFLAYSVVDNMLFYRLALRDLRSRMSTESHEAFTNRMACVREGMTTNQVAQLLGKPTSTTSSNNTETLTYEWNTLTGFDWRTTYASGDSHTFTFVCRSGAVERLEQHEGHWGGDL